MVSDLMIISGPDCDGWHAGLVSITLLDKPLFGPAHMHMQQPTKSHFIGDLSPQSNPLHYLSCIRSLHEWYWKHSGTTKDGETVRPPLVINTHGWIKVCVFWEADAMLCHFVLCGAVLCCAVLCCAVLCCAVLADCADWLCKTMGVSTLSDCVT